MTVNFDGVYVDPVAGWLGVDDKEDLPPSLVTRNEWFPMWDSESHLIELPEGVSRVMVAVDTAKGQKIDFFYWNQEKKAFAFDEAGKELVPDQMVGYFVSWALEPEAPQIW